MSRNSDHTPRTAVFPGSFNPFTTGHMDIVRRGLRIFDRIIVAVGYNEHKGDSGEIGSRIAALERLFAECPEVEVASYTGLTVDFARRVGAHTILRGVRGSADMEYERALADTNAAISGIDTVFMVTRPELSYVSSSMVRELEHNGYDTSRFLPRPFCRESED